MEKYRKVKDLFCNRNSRFQLDQISFISYCDYAIQDRYIPELNYKDKSKQIECMNELKDNDTVFIDYHLTHDKINLLLSILRIKEIKLNFLYLEEPIPNKQVMEALLPFAHNIYALNNIYIHSSIHSLFLGPYPASIRNLLKEKDIVRNKEYLCLLEFQMGPVPRFTQLVPFHCTTNPYSGKFLFTAAYKLSFESEHNETTYPSFIGRVLPLAPRSFQSIPSQAAT